MLILKRVLRGYQFAITKDVPRVFSCSSLLQTPSKNTGLLKEADTPPTVLETSDIDHALKKISVQYPQPLGTLNNIMAAVSREVKSETKTLEVVYKPVGKKHLTGWLCQFHLNWPSTVTFSATGKTKSDASKLASLKALQYLASEGKLKGNKPVLYEGKILPVIKKTSVQLELNSSSVAKLEKVFESYSGGIKDVIENVLKNPRVEEQAVEKNFDVQYSESQRLRMVKARNQHLQRRLLQREYEDESSAGKELPILKFRDQILETIRENQVVIIKGEPGCGKSTQVPQYILDEASKAGNGCDVNIVVSQPRRISAITLSERVAMERNEEVGDAVGYQVRFNSRKTRPPGGSINFCSSGILLRTLQNNPNLDGISHVILDEAHERDVNTDLLMLLMKRLLIARPDLKLLVMSATINPELFQNYYSGAVALPIPGFTYPVESHFLEDISEKLCNLSQTRKNLDQKNPRLFHDEIAKVIAAIDRTKPPGAVLCFVPGWQDIKHIMDHLQKLMPRNLVLPLHSRLTYDDQSKVFRRPPEGVRKIIIATNVAETSITIDDVVYVVDTGVHKEERLSADKSSAVLDDDWVSQANVNQRRGRAGRVQPGQCYHLYSRSKFESLPQYPVPELHRVPLQKVVLDLKTYNEKEKAAHFLSGMPEPPTRAATECAVNELVQLGALADDESLTNLGRRIAKFSTSPVLSKALVYGVILRCLNPILNITSILSADADMFMNSLEERSDIADLKREHNRYSDHFALLSLFNEWKKMYDARESDELFCIRNLLRRNTLRLIHRIRQLSLEQLLESRMITDSDYEEYELPVGQDFVKTVFLSATLSFMFQRSWSVKNGKLKMNAPSLITEDGNKASLSSDCVCHKTNNLPSPFLTYFRRQESAIRRLTIVRDASVISPTALALFAPKFHNNSLSTETDVTVLSDVRNLPFRLLSKSKDADVIFKTRAILNDLTAYFLSVEGAEIKDENYEKVSQFRDTFVLALSDLVTNSTHSVHFNETNQQ